MVLVIYRTVQAAITKVELNKIKKTSHYPRSGLLLFVSGTRVKIVSLQAPATLMTGQELTAVTTTMKPILVITARSPRNSPSAYIIITQTS